METAQLPVLSHKHSGHRSHPELVAYCDAHDLVAIVTLDFDVIVYRITGHTAYSIKRSPYNDSDEITSLAWKPDGSALAIGWSDGHYGVHSGENGKALSSGFAKTDSGRRRWTLDLASCLGGDDLDDDEDEDGLVKDRRKAITCIGWTTHRLELPSTKVPDATGAATTEDWFDDLDQDFGHLSVDGTKAKATGARNAIKPLANAIATLDVTKVLPRLSAIPTHGVRLGPEGNRFSTQTATAAILEADKGSSARTVDLLLFGTGDGAVHVLLDDAVKIGSFATGRECCMHAANAGHAAHTIVSQDLRALDCVTSTLSFDLDALSGPLLNVTARSTKRMQNILAYTVQTIRCIQHDYTTGLQFPSRVLQNMNETLKENTEGDITASLYHLAMTGAYTPTMLEWLVDILKETNHKRWDQAITALYTNIQNHVFINLIPALDHLTIAVTSLRGLATFHEGTTRFDVASSLLTKVLDGIDSLRVAATEVQDIVMTEFRQFKAFSKWLRIMIEIGVAGPGSKSAMEAEEREMPNLDYGLILQYIQGTMAQSKLKRHVEHDSKSRQTFDTKEDFLANPLIAQMSFEATNEALSRLQRLKTGEQLQMKDVADPMALLNLPALAVYLAGVSTIALDAITAWRSKTLPPVSSLPVDMHSPIAIKDCATGVSSTFTALGLANEEGTSSNLLQIAQTMLPPSPHAAMDFHTVALTADVQHILDLAFLHDEKDTVIISAQGTTDDGETVTQLRRTTLPAICTARDHAIELETSVLHAFPLDASIGAAGKLVVGGREGKKVCVVLDAAGKEWYALDLGDGAGQSGLTSEDVDVGEPEWEDSMEV